MEQVAAQTTHFKLVFSEAGIPFADGLQKFQDASRLSNYR
jgi:hypothetical protein